MGCTVAGMMCGSDPVPERAGVNAARESLEPEGGLMLSAKLCPVYNLSRLE
jgi:hypothetical protein